MGKSRKKKDIWERMHGMMDQIETVSGLKDSDNEEKLQALWKKRAEELARPSKEEEESLIWQKLIILQVGNERYAFKVDDIEEIMQVPPITMVPCTPPHYIGVINRRGSILPVVDLKVLFGSKRGKVTKESRVVVLNNNRLVIGLLVEAADQIIGLPPEKIKPPLKSGEGTHAEFCSGVITLGKDVVVLIDSLKLLKDYRMRVE